MTNSISGIEGMEVIFIIGSNTKETHPVIANWMIKAYRKGAKIIVADPRKVPMVRFADTFLRLKPGTTCNHQGKTPRQGVHRGTDRGLQRLGQDAEGIHPG
jgi:predicted molibdopterin-dependent oxidoreductase YjgC